MPRPSDPRKRPTAAAVKKDAAADRQERLERAAAARLAAKSPPPAGTDVCGPAFLTLADVHRRVEAREKARDAREKPPMPPRQAWRDRDLARGAFMLGAGYSHGEIALALGRPQSRVAATMRKLGLHSRNTVSSRLLQVIWPQGLFETVFAAAEERGQRVSQFVAAAAVAEAVRVTPSAMRSVQAVAGEVPPPAMAHVEGVPPAAPERDRGLLLGTEPMPPQVEALLNAKMRDVARNGLKAKPLPKRKGSA